MKRISAVVVGIVALLAVGVLAIHAQQPEGRNARPGDREGLRKKLVELRSDVELLRLRRDAIRETLLEEMKRAEHLKFVDGTDCLTPIGRSALYAWAITGEKQDESIKVSGALALQLINELEENKKELEKDAEKDAKKFGDALRAALDHKVKDFSRLLTELNQKTLELDDLERQYREGR